MARREPLWGNRMVEWGVLVLVILVLAGSFGYHAYRVQGQAERAAVISTLGALRTGLAIEHLRASVASHTSSAQSPNNPFEVLQRLPPNYGGLVAGRNVEATTPGNWVFDPDCPCIGYKPMHAQWLEQPADAPALWYHIRRDSAVRELQPMQDYRWQGQMVP